MWFSSLEELLENKEDIHCYSDCDSMEDVARYYVEETGQLGEVLPIYKIILTTNLWDVIWK